jgi:hypothetical protein
MLHCTMSTPMNLHLSLDDMLADLRHARRQGDLGRLALLAYCDVRRWARQAGEVELAEQSAAMFTDQPHASREVFLAQVDTLVFELARLQNRLPSPARNGVPPRADLAPGQHASPG